MKKEHVTWGCLLGVEGASICKQRPDLISNYYDSD